ncbi:HD-GYP domain-containing protein [Desulfosporosinus sp. SB140]|uniref:HD-GYP domain-containing protein n=1 Tax=Desulfosporosinus paludis TaxID=3115649 RepID=UPI003890FE1C
MLNSYKRNRMLSIGEKFLNSFENYKDEIKSELEYINYTRCHNFFILLIAASCILIYTDILGKGNGLWDKTPAYRLLFYSHIVILATMSGLLILSWFTKINFFKNKLFFYRFISLFFAVFWTFMGAGTSVNDQLIHGQITVYVFTSCAVAIILYIKPFISFIIYFLSYLIFIIGITKVQGNYNILRGNYINGTLIVVVAWLLSVLLYDLKVKDFIKKKTIERQRNELQSTNRELSKANSQLELSLRALDESQNMIFTLAMALESKDPYTHGHSERVAEYSLELARYLGLPEKLQENLWRAAILHDIGKIGIPDAILNKTGSLSNEEWPIMKSHPENGENICSKLNFAREILPVIRYHHERYDGNGYPDGLIGDNIPYLARIISISDTVDAITSKRSYRLPRTFQTAIDELIKGAGTQFDPVLVNAFVELFKSGKLVPKKESTTLDKLRIT